MNCIVANDSTKKITHQRVRAIHCLLPLKTDDRKSCKTIIQQPSDPQPRLSLSTIIDRYYLDVQALDRQRVELILTTIGSGIVFLPHIIWKIIFDLQPGVLINPNKFKNKLICDKKNYEEENDKFNDHRYDHEKDEFYEDINEWKRYRTKSRNFNIYPE